MKTNLARPVLSQTWLQATRNSMGVDWQVGAGARMLWVSCLVAATVALLGSPLPASAQVKWSGLYAGANFSSAFSTVDFSVADAARVTLPWLAMHGIHAVVGTTGFSDDDLDLLRSAFCDAESAHCLVAPNFAISALASRIGIRLPLR